MLGETAWKTGAVISKPPASSWLAIALPSWSLGVWQLPHATMLRIRYAPRSSAVSDWAAGEPKHNRDTDSELTHDFDLRPAARKLADDKCKKCRVQILSVRRP